MILPPLNEIPLEYLILLVWVTSVIIAYIIGYQHHKISCSLNELIKHRKRDSI